MATSGTRDGAFTVAQISADALSLIQVGVGGETLATEYLDHCITTLKLMGRAWMVDGVRLWLQETQSLTMVAATASYAITKRPVEVLQAWRRVSNNDTPIRIVTREEYERFPDKTTGGAPFAVWIDRQRTATTAYLYPVPTATEVADAMTVKVDIKRPIEDVTAGAEDMEVPAEWIPAVTYNLAVWIAPKFNKEASATVKSIASTAYQSISGQDREGSVIFRVGRRR